MNVHSPKIIFPVSVYLATQYLDICRKNNISTILNLGLFNILGWHNTCRYSGYWRLWGFISKVDGLPPKRLVVCFCYQCGKCRRHAEGQGIYVIDAFIFWRILKNIKSLRSYKLNIYFCNSGSNLNTYKMPDFDCELLVFFSFQKY